MFASISIQIEILNKKRLKLHDQLKKIKSSLSIQIRIEKIDFVSFLFKRKILEIMSISCWCDWNNQTIKYVIMFCELMNDKKRMLSNIDIIDYHQMTTSNKKFKTINKWLLQHNLLLQFALITTLFKSTNFISFRSRYHRRNNRFFYRFFVESKWVIHDFLFLRQTDFFHVNNITRNSHKSVFDWCFIEIMNIYLSIYSKIIIYIT
jgi:hypothetical protein